MKGSVWQRENFWKNFNQQILKNKNRLKVNPKDWGAMSGMVSGYYTASMTSYSLSQGFVRKLWWYFWTWIYIEKSLWWAKKLWKNIPSTSLTASHCDVIQSTFRKASMIPWYKNLLEWTHSVIDRGHELCRKERLPENHHTVLFLWLGMLDVRDRLYGEDASEQLESLAVLFSRAVKKVSTGLALHEKDQFARIFRSLRDFYIHYGQGALAHECGENARRLATEAEATDQLGKLGSVQI